MNRLSGISGRSIRVAVALTILPILVVTTAQTALAVEINGTGARVTTNYGDWHAQYFTARFTIADTSCKDGGVYMTVNSYAMNGSSGYELFPAWNGGCNSSKNLGSLTFSVGNHGRRVDLRGIMIRACTSGKPCGSGTYLDNPKT